MSVPNGDTGPLRDVEVLRTGPQVRASSLRSGVEGHRRPTTPYAQTVPVGATARRLTWAFLPAPLRRAVETEIGTEVVTGVSQDAGFTPGFASVLTGADGTRHFVKAASWIAQAPFARAYDTEARRLAALPDLVPAPPLLWSVQAADWLAFGTRYVEGTPPGRPWDSAELHRCLAMLAQLAQELTPAPTALGDLPSFAEDHAGIPGCWDRVASWHPDLPGLGEAAALAARLPELGGTSVVHTDVRYDNLIVTPSRVWLCDWNWASIGPAWIDTLSLLLEAYGDGFELEPLLADLTVFSGVAPEHVDIALALLTGYFAVSAAELAPPSSPFIRRHQGWMCEVAYGWLAQRRGWSVWEGGW